MTMSRAHKERQCRRSSSIFHNHRTMTTMSITIAIICYMISLVSGHGYLKSPRSRNLVAYQDKNWESYLSQTGGSSTDPYPEDCLHCLNRGGILAQCGISPASSAGGVDRNYDTPKNSNNENMSVNLQGIYRQGDVIDIEVLVTTHHKGHFEFAVCPINGVSSNDNMPMEVPTADCFKNNKLQFLSDELYGAPPDPQYPERAYIAPSSIVTWTNGENGEQPVTGAPYQMKFKLPDDIYGDTVLLQWYYLTANSCKHEGYSDYNFPIDWIGVFDESLPDCGEIPLDGNGVPEQFWNCAEIRIVSKDAPLESVADTMIQAPLASAEQHNNNNHVITITADDFSPPPENNGPCIDDTSSYYEATEDCKGYIYCVNGVPSADTPIYCGDDMLYDITKQSCNWANEVTCNSAGPPTNKPTAKPNILMDWDYNNNVDRGHDKTIIGYYASWQWYDRDGLAKPTNMDFNKITRANFAFFQITEDGYIYGTDNWADPITLFGMYDWASEEGTAPQYCSWDEPNEPPACMAHKYEEGLIYQAHAAGAEVYPSIGGWSLSDPFPVMAANADSRARFAQQCVDLIKSYNFDGIDLDWEYPGYEPHSGTPDDTVNFNLLLDDVRAALDQLEAETGRYYGLTAALPCGPSIIANQDIAHVGRLLTELNLMTYDFHGSWNEKTGVNAPLYDQEDSPEFSVHGCVENWLEGGAPKEKINIGFPFYGRSFLGADHLYEPHEGNDDATWHVDEGVPQYYNIMDKMNELTSVRDEQTMTQYAYGSTGMVSYDDERAICDKTEYAQVHDLNGYIIWELSGDLMPDLTTPLLDAANAKLFNPSLDCESLDASDYIGIDAAIEGAAIEEEVANLYYPNSDTATCLNDGLEAEWILDKDKYSSLTACCMAHFSWNNDCVSSGELADAVSELEDQTSVIWYSSTTAPECLSDGNQPSYYRLDRKVRVSIVLSCACSLHSTAEVCCNVHYTGSYHDCIARSYAAAASPSDADIVLPSNAVEESIVNQATDKFFPVFGDDGTTSCMTGMPPSWMSRNDMKDTKGDCCHSYTLSNDNECNLSNPYYPDFENQKCLNDGNHPDWMVGEYLSYSEAECSSMFEAILSLVEEEERPDDNTLVEVQTTSTTTTSSTILSSDPTIIEDIPPEVSSSLGAAAAVESILESHIDILDNAILVYETPEMDWKPSPVYQSRDMIEAIRTMATEGIANKFFYTGDDSDNGHVYGLVNVATFLAQAMKETIKYNACDENSWDAVGGGYPLSNACGQLGQSYQDYHCSEAEKHMECPVDKNMEITATTGAKWWGAPAPLFCGPKEKYPHTGYWDHSVDCNNQWSDPPMSCDTYDGQKGGDFNNDSPAANSAGRTDVEGCCWWGRGVIQTTGVCNFGKLNYYLGSRAAEEGRQARYPDIDFCKTPDAICASEMHKELKWIAGLFYWVESLQSYNVGGWNYMDELHKFVDNGMSDGNKFIDAVSGIVNRGCHNPPCTSGGVDGAHERAQNFDKVLKAFDLIS